jgi:hypothetical protein
MKKFKEVEKNRVQYHSNGNENSVHKASLLVPELEGSTTEISFVNHFLLKRSYNNVACRITGVDKDGKKLTAYLHQISEPRVYTFNLSEMFEHKAKSYIVDFFAAENLYIPFPAVMINHYSDGFFNSVHSYNRVLNDVFEDDAVNEVKVKESSIDVQVDTDTDTFVLFNAGHADCSGVVKFELLSKNDNRAVEKEVNVKRFTATEFRVSELFDVKNISNNAVLKIKQPTQHLFYGRILAGQVKKNSGNFSANHSYYDSSSVSEYWDNNIPSSRLYPFFKQLDNSVRMHPIMSPGTLQIDIVLYGEGEEKLAEFSVGEVTSPGEKLLDVNINDLAQKETIPIEKIVSFEVIAKPLKGNTPTRINHQLVYQKNGNLYSSVNISLVNANVFVPPNKKATAWGQIIANDEVDSFLGIVRNTAIGTPENIEIEFYDKDGKLGAANYTLAPGGSVLLNTKDDLAKIVFGKKDYGKNIWYIIKANCPDITAIVVSKNNKTNHCTGEHSF